ncbi:minor capsid protein [Romboutsia sp. MSSM.1001216sp_RTP31141st1_G3_RTP31141_220114]|uniref:minor capsid protein n=1 Tax=unclassified Romboutsia TaxID=2626894 RepID=UPI0031B5AA18
MKSKIYHKKEKNTKYWSKRFEILEDLQNKEASECLEELHKQYDIALKRIEKDILHWYNRLALNNDMSLSDVSILLNKNELKEFKWTVEEYIKYGKENAINQRWLKELENASAKVHISRLESIKIQIQNHLETLYQKEIENVDGLIKGIYTEGYYRTAYEISKGIGVAVNLSKLDIASIEQIIKKPWTTDGTNFSKRIWGKHRPQLINELHTQLTQMFIRGDDPQIAINNIAREFGVSKRQAGNLVMTESAFFMSKSRNDCFNTLGVERYEIVATLDSKTSEICQSLDGEVFPMKLYEIGVTAPPFHNYCRTTTAPFFDDEFTLNEERIARDKNGNTIYVPSNMKYKEYKEKYLK